MELATLFTFFQIIDIGRSYLLFQEDKSGTATVAGDTLTTILTDSIIQCARKCSIEPKCSTYMYTDAHRLCHLFSADTDNMTTLESLTGQAAFKVYNTVQGLYKCPIQNGEWETAVLPDGSKTRFRLFSKNVKNNSEAWDICLTNNAKLPAILTPVKMNFFRETLVQCPEIENLNLWLDGSNTDAENFFGPGAWTTLEGQAIPMSQGDFWLPDRPNQPDTDHCLRLWKKHGNQFDDTDCGQKNACLCEKP